MTSTSPSSSSHPSHINPFSHLSLGCNFPCASNTCRLVKNGTAISNASCLFNKSSTMESTCVIIYVPSC